METASVNTENLIITSLLRLHHREQLIRMIEEDGITIKDSARTLGINFNTARTIIATYRKTGKVATLKRGAARRLLCTQENIDRIEDIVSLNSLFSLRQIKEKLLETDKVKMSILTIKNALEN